MSCILSFISVLVLEVFSFPTAKSCCQLHVWLKIGPQKLPKKINGVSKCSGTFKGSLCSCDATHSHNSSLKLSQTLVREKTFQKSLKGPKKHLQTPWTSHMLQDWSCDWKSCRELASLSIFLIIGVYQEGDATSSSLSLLNPAAKKANNTLTIIFTS